MKRIFTVLGFLAILNGYVGARMMARWPLAQEHPGIFWLGMACFTLLQIAGPFGDEIDFFLRLKHNKLLKGGGNILNWLCYIAIGTFSCLLIFTLVADVVALLWQLIAPPADEAAFQYNVFRGIMALTGATIVLGVLQTRIGPAVKRVDIVLEKLPAAFEGFKIVQISDLHVGPTIGRRFAEKVVEIGNGLQPDVFALTGDFIDGSKLIKNKITNLA